MGQLAWLGIGVYGICCVLKTYKYLDVLFQSWWENSILKAVNNRLTEEKILGPNYVWHVAGYDMLKPYGFLIHGFIDRWSRKFMWLKVTRSNNHHPDIVGNFYLGCLWSRRLPSQTEDWLWHGEWSDGSNGVHLWRGCPCAQVWIIAGQSENRGLVGIL